jgi:hypothetical protein
MRDRIIKDKRFKIKFVPCILNVNQLSGVISQYEADKAFELVYTQLQMIEDQEMERQMQMQPPPEIEHKVESMVPSAPPPQSADQKPGHTSISELMDEDEDQDEVDDQDEYIKKPAIPERQESGNSIKKRINVSEIMSKSKKESTDTMSNMMRPSYSPSGVDITKGPPEPIKSVKAGSPISVAEIMAQAGKDNQKI